MLPNIHILGIQGSGKGTQSALLVEKYTLSYISSGNLFRERAALDDPYARELREQLRLGHLLPDQYLLDTVNFHLDHHPVSKGLIGDGIIRSMPQLVGLHPIWETHNLEDPLLIHLLLTEEVALQRIAHRVEEAGDPSKEQYHKTYSGKLLFRRTDDTPEAIRERFSVFHTITEPLLQHFETQGRCVHIDANQPIETVFLHITDAIHSYYPTLIS